MRKLLISISIFFLVVLIVVFGYGHYKVSQYLKPGVLEAEVSKVIKKSFPHGKVELGKIDYSIGLNVKVNIEKFSLSLPLKSKEINLIDVKKVNVKVPLFGILIGSKEAALEIESPIFNYQKIGKRDNWSLAMGEKKLTKIQEKKEGKIDTVQGVESARLENEKKGVKGEVALAGFSFNILISSANIQYRDGVDHLSINIDHFKLNDLGLNKSASFEIKNTFKKKNVISFDGLIIGEIDLKNVLGKNEIKATTEIKLSNIDLVGHGLIPYIKTNLVTSILKSGEIKSRVKTVIGEDNHINVDINIIKDLIKIKDIDVKLIASKLLNYFPKHKTNLKEIDFSKTNLLLNGGVNLKNNRPEIMLEGEVGPSLKLSVNGTNLDTSVKFSFKRNVFQSKAITKVYDGVITTDTSLKIDPLNVDLKNFPTVNVGVIVDSLKIKERMKIEAKRKNEGVISSKQEKSTSQKEVALKEESTPPLIPPMNVKIKFLNNEIGDSKLNGEMSVDISKKSDLKVDSDLVFGGGKIGMNVRSKVLPILKGQYSLDLDNVDFTGLSKILPKGTVSKITGVLSVDSKGNFKQSKENLTYSADVKLLGKMFGFDGYNFGKSASEYVRSIPSLSKFVKKDFDFKAGSKLELIEFEGSLTEKKISSKKFKMILEGKKAEASGNGNISMLEKDSTVYVSLKDNTGKLAGPLKKNTGTDILPLMLVGKGTALKPDYQYTVKKLSKGLVKKKGKKLVEKQLNKILKEKKIKGLDKLLKGKNKEKVDKLLKGFFK